MHTAHDPFPAAHPDQDVFPVRDETFYDPDGWKVPSRREMARSRAASRAFKARRVGHVATLEEWERIAGPVIFGPGWRPSQ